MLTNATKMYKRTCLLHSKGKGLSFICSGDLSHEGISVLRTTTKYKEQNLKGYSQEQSLCQHPLNSDSDEGVNPLRIFENPPINSC